jgi:putative flippase GtrA
MSEIHLNSAPARYLAIGIGCAVLNNAILIGADATGAHYVVAILLTFVITLPIAYLAHTIWTFSAELSWLAFVRFITGSISSVLLAGAAVGSLKGGLGLSMWIAAPLATVAMTVYNFMMARWAIDRRN